MRRTITTTGRAMFLTSAMLVAGFSVLFVSNVLGIVHVTALMCVILIAALFGDLVLLPALLLTFRGERVRGDERERLADAERVALAASPR